MIFWLMLLWVTIIGLMFQPSMSKTLQGENGSTYSQVNKGFCILLWSLPFFFICMCTSFGDKSGYIAHFNESPMDFAELENYVGQWEKSGLFYSIQGVVKILFIRNAPLWFSLIALLQAICVSRTFRKYSVNYSMSMFIFTASTMMMSWMINGIRQFIAVSVLFACTKWILDGKWIRYLILTLIFAGIVPIANMMGFHHVPMLLGGVHQSALIMLPVFFAIRGKAFSLKLWIILGLTAFLLVVDAFSGFLSFTSYGDELINLEQQEGSNPLRLLIAMVPLVMVILKYHMIKESERPPVIDLAINASVVTAMLYALSTIMSGEYLGRLPIYTELYNLILIPWLIEKIYIVHSQWIKLGLYAGYFGYFFYQVNIAWDTSPYQSSILGIF